MKSLFHLLLFFSLPVSLSYAQEVSRPSPSAPPAAVDSAASANSKQTLREEAVRRAAVWREPSVPIERYDFLNGEKGPDAFDPKVELSCRWEFTKVGGRTPKFLCKFPNGDSLKVKYHLPTNPNPEVPAEIVASRLLRALGFGADRMYTVKNLKCWGCPADPFPILDALFNDDPSVREKFLREHGVLQADGTLAYTPDYSKWNEFNIVSIERSMEGRPILDNGVSGFALSELQDPGYLGSKPQVDALNLLLAFLYNSDTTVQNQDLLCMDPDYSEGRRCRSSFVSIQDAGAVLGGGMQPDGKTLNKFDWEQWRRAPVWADEKLCLLNISSHRWATFGKPRIGEEGRVFLSKLLQRLSRKQVAELFRGAKTYEYSESSEPEKIVIDRWGQVFFEKLEAITKKKDPCPEIAK